MSFEENPEFASQVADLNKYGQALNNCESVEEVVSLGLEAVSLLFELPFTTFVEVRDGDPRVVHSTYPEVAAGEAPGPVVEKVIERQDTVLMDDESGGDGGADIASTLVVPGTIVDDVVAVIVVRSRDAGRFGDDVVRPLEILASHAATAISNIRRREHLERARQDLEKRKEMVEMYDRLLRHDLGNDLQLVASYAEKIAADADGEVSEYADRIKRNAMSSADLIGRVGDLVNTLEQQDEPEPQSLAAELEEVVGNTEEQYESLTIEFERDAVDYRVFGGDLLDSVFTNLLSNAAVHNEGSVHVQVSTANATGDTVTVSIADDGSGIPEAIRDSLFEMGEKGPDSHGTGFGLGFVKALTESYGGDIGVTEGESGGADFRVTLERA